MAEWLTAIRQRGGVPLKIGRVVYRGLAIERVRQAYADCRLALQFLGYGWKQCRIYFRYRAVRDSFSNSCINYKRTHYLEKAMYVEQPKDELLDRIYGDLRPYVDAQTADSEPNLGYLNKMLREYAAYPKAFRCFMLDVPPKPVADGKARAVEMVLKQRRSVRSFRPEPVPDDIIERLVTAATYAPSSCNGQALQYLVLRDRAVLEDVFSAAEGSKAWTKDVPNGILVLADRRPYKPFMQHIIMAQDVAAATQNLLLMAHALGLGACWVSLLSDSHFIDQDRVCRQLDIPDYMYVGAAVAFGSPRSSVCHVPRRPASRLVHYDRFRPGVWPGRQGADVR